MRAAVGIVMVLASTMLGWATETNNKPSRNFTSLFNSKFAASCGPAGCCSDPQCYRTHTSEWDPKMGRCSPCAAR